MEMDLTDPATASAVSDEIPGIDPTNNSESSASDEESETELEETVPKAGAPSAALPVSSFSLPIYVKVPSTSEQLSIAYFPMNTANYPPGVKISAVTRNSVDGRIRCEIDGSTIQAREETTEGIPVDYHIVWESSNVPANTFRDDYYAVKQNGKVFLTPAQTMYMRAVVEPKSTRQSESQRIGIVSHSNNSREAQHAAALASAGKWIPYNVDRIPPNQSYRIDETQVRHTEPTPAESSANLETVISLALSLKGSGPSSGPVPRNVDGSRKTVVGTDNLEIHFKNKERFHKTAKIQQLTGKSVEESVRVLADTAFLVQGVWAGSGSLYFTKNPTTNKLILPFAMSYDYLLSFFARDRIVDVTRPNTALNLSLTHLNSLLSMMATHVEGSRWRFVEEPDTVFLQSYPEIVKQQDAVWEERRGRIDQAIADLEAQRQAATPLTSPSRVDVPVGKRIAPNSAPPAKRIAEEIKAMRSEDESFKRPVSAGSGLRGGRGGRGGRGRGRGRGR